jgi:hypothetical protein
MVLVIISLPIVSFMFLNHIISFQPLTKHYIILIHLLIYTCNTKHESRENHPFYCKSLANFITKLYLVHLFTDGNQLVIGTDCILFIQPINRFTVYTQMLNVILNPSFTILHYYHAIRTFI